MALRAARSGTESPLAKAAIRAVVLISAIGALAIAGLYLINRDDEPLSPEVAAVLAGRDLTDITPRDNVFFDFIGFSLDTRGDLHQEGQRVFDHYMADRGRRTSGDPSVYDIYSGEKLIAFNGDRKALCPLRPTPDDPLQSHCIDQAVPKRDVWTSLIADNAIILSRYRSLLAGRAYDNRFQPDMLMPIQPWVVPTQAKSLVLSSWALQVSAGSIDAVISDLDRDTSFWRRMLAQRGLTLIDKMLALAQVRVDLLFVSDLLHRTPLTPAQFEGLGLTLAPITVAERSLAGPMDMELRTSASFIDQEPALGKRRAVAGTAEFDFIGWLTSDRIQSHATENRLYQGEHAVGVASELPCQDVGMALDAIKKDTELSSKDYVYNRSGAVMAQIGILAYRSYVMRLCDLEGLQRLVASQRIIRRDHIADASVPAFLEQEGTSFADPFSGKPMHWNPTDHSVRFNAGDASDQAFTARAI